MPVRHAHRCEFDAARYRLARGFFASTHDVSFGRIETAKSTETAKQNIFPNQRRRPRRRAGRGLILRPAMTGFTYYRDVRCAGVWGQAA